MAEEVAKIARRVNEVVENGGNHLDLSNCALTSFPTGLYISTGPVADKITSISLANNELKSLAGKFFIFYKGLEELDLAGNLLEKLPFEASLLCNLKIINLARNKLDAFPEELTEIQSIQNINLEGNQIKDIPTEALNKLPCLSSVNLKDNLINKDNVPKVKFEVGL
ncbi:leucine-rich repeat-containing protein 20 [Eleutherodactylus coqui]|uniref:leucine-rich repeat-containing protein 20 n=1 Tax=Eleutherodactylus coqui TaxID=57060 RepID=UPI003462B525